jgi:hypothetical protein
MNIRRFWVKKDKKGLCLLEDLIVLPLLEALQAQANTLLKEISQVKQCLNIQLEMNPEMEL